MLEFKPHEIVVYKGKSAIVMYKIHTSTEDNPLYDLCLNDKGERSSYSFGVKHKELTKI